jgi:peptidoglycan hydrolase CwlO-like protein
LLGGLLLIIITAILIGRSYLKQKSSNKKLNEQNNLISNQKEEIETTLGKLEETNKKLEDKGSELEKFNSAMLDREMRILELKEEANKLSKASNSELPYPEIEED